MTCFYFGAWSRNKVGHFLYAPGGWTARRNEMALPFRPHILDAGLLPQEGEQAEGHIVRAVIGNWTVLTFWDRSADSRGQSNSAFVFDAVAPTEDLLAVARVQFPEVFNRFTFELKECPK